MEVSRIQEFCIRILGDTVLKFGLYSLYDGPGNRQPRDQLRFQPRQNRP
jgi:hypothetical protein